MGALTTEQAVPVVETQLPPGFFPPPGLPALPGLHSTPATGASAVQSATRQIAPPSIGSIGHPHKCGQACRYVKRKGGCRDGEACTSCHLCFWHRAGEQQAENQIEGLCLVADYASVGTVGHPETCQEPCKYVRRKGGCRDGANCPNCHACQWRRDKPADAADDKEQVSANPVEAGLFGDAGENLRGLIATLLTSQ